MTADGSRHETLAVKETRQLVGSYSLPRLPEKGFPEKDWLSKKACAPCKALCSFQPIMWTAWIR